MPSGHRFLLLLCTNLLVLNFPQLKIIETDIFTVEVYGKIFFRCAENCNNVFCVFMQFQVRKFWKKFGMVYNFLFKCSLRKKLFSVRLKKKTEEGKRCLFLCKERLWFQNFRTKNVVCGDDFCRLIFKEQR